MNKPRRRPLVLLVCGLLLLQGCAIPGITTREPALTLPSAYGAATTGEQSAAAIRWNDFFVDPNLARLAVPPHLDHQPHPLPQTLNGISGMVLLNESQQGARGDDAEQNQGIDQPTREDRDEGRKDQHEDERTLKLG